MLELVVVFGFVVEVPAGVGDGQAVGVFGAEAQGSKTRGVEVAEGGAAGEGGEGCEEEAAVKGHAEALVKEAVG